MKTTLRELHKINGFNFNKLNGFNFNKLTSNLGTSNLDTQVTILQILELNGIFDAIKALRTQKYKDYCLFLADVAESVLHLYEDKYPEDNRPRKCIEGIRLYHSGKITRDELDDLENINTSGYAAARAAHFAADAHFAATGYYAVYHAARAAHDDKWEGVEKLFIHHFDNIYLLDDSLFVI